MEELSKLKSFILASTNEIIGAIEEEDVFFEVELIVSIFRSCCKISERSNPRTLFHASSTSFAAEAAASPTAECEKSDAD